MGEPSKADVDEAIVIALARIHRARCERNPSKRDELLIEARSALSNVVGSVLDYRGETPDKRIREDAWGLINELLFAESRRSSLAVVDVPTRRDEPPKAKPAGSKIARPREGGK